MPDQPKARSFTEALQDRRFWGPVLAYLVAGFGIVEAADILFPRLEFSADAAAIPVVVLLFAFPIVVAIAWRRAIAAGGPTASSVPPALSLVLIAAGSTWLGVRAFPDGEMSAAVASPEATPPLVIMMDSPHPDRVYDESTLAANGTNADVISDILLDLPIRRQRENIGPAWHRDEEILQFDPDLIVVHFSGFRQGFGPEPRERLKSFISFFVEADTKFLIYSRGETAVVRTALEELLADLEADHPGVLARISVFGLGDYGPLGEVGWRTPLVANPLKLRVKEMLGL